MATRETGFHFGGFPGVVNHAVIPLVDARIAAAPTRAARPLGRLLDVGLRRRPGPHLQGMLVEPTAFSADLAAMGVEVWAQPSSTECSRSIAPGDDRG